MSFCQSEVNEILDKLEDRYPDADCALEHGSIFQLLVAVVLSAQTTDKSVNVVTKDLFAKYPDAYALAEASQEDVAEMIKRIGMYKTKSKNILALAKMLVEKYDGQVPEDYDRLIELPGVGRKTANVVLAVGFGHQRIAVDTHVFRVSNRTQLAPGKTPEEVEEGLMKVIPKEDWASAHHWLIFHGRRVCHARSPECGICTLREYCPEFGKQALKDKIQEK